MCGWEVLIITICFSKKSPYKAVIANTVFFWARVVVGYWWYDLFTNHDTRIGDLLLLHILCLITAIMLTVTAIGGYKNELFRRIGFI